MAFPPGTRLGPYEILAPIGAGGMGEVYRAKDVRLDRTVAIKVLPPHFSTNPEMRQHFEHEAQAIAGLTTPTSALCMTLAGTRASTFWSWSTWKGRPWPIASSAVPCPWQRP